MRPVWTAKDPLRNEIRLTENCWKQHILVEHPIMRGFLREIRTTVQQPDWIFQSRVSRSTLLYFKEYRRKPVGRFFLMVVAGVRGTSPRGFVKTAFLVYNLSKGGNLLWERSSGTRTMPRVTN